MRIQPAFRRDAKKVTFVVLEASNRKAVRFLPFAKQVFSSLFFPSGFFPGTSSPEDYYGWLFDGIVFFLLIVIWQASKFYNKILRRLTDRERIRIRWGVQPQWDIVPTSTRSPNNSTRGVASPFANGPGGPSGLSPSRPRLVALPTLSSSLSINLDRKPKPSSSFSLPPAVWASLSEEHKPKGEKWKLRKRLLLTENGDDSSSTESNHPQEEVQALEETHVDGVNIEIYNLDVKLKSCGKYVVSGASANFRSSKLTVLMGPSGCGAFLVFFLLQ